MQYCDNHSYEKTVEVDRTQRLQQSGRKTLDDGDEEVEMFEKGFKDLGKQSDEQMAHMDIDGLIAALSGEEIVNVNMDIKGRKTKKGDPPAGKTPVPALKDDEPKPKPGDDVDSTEKALQKTKAMLNVLTQKSAAIESFLPKLKGALLALIAQLYKPFCCAVKFYLRLGIQDFARSGL